MGGGLLCTGDSGRSHFYSSPSDVGSCDLVRCWTTWLDVQQQQGVGGWGGVTDLCTGDQSHSQKGLSLFKESSFARKRDLQ